MAIIVPTWEQVLARYVAPTRLLTPERYEAFTVVSSDVALTITPESTRKSRRLTQGDFEKAVQLLGRSSIQEATRNSSYIAAIVEDFRRRP